jgi:hypothetical protein
MFLTLILNFYYNNLYCTNNCNVGSQYVLKLTCHYCILAGGLVQRPDDGLVY